MAAIIGCGCAPAHPVRATANSSTEGSATTRAPTAPVGPSVAASPPPSRPPNAPASSSSPDCSAIPAIECVGATVSRRLCESVAPLVVPEVGAAWMACVVGGAPGEICDAGRAVRCGLLAATKATSDPREHLPRCAALAPACEDVAPEITVERCAQLMAAFRPEHRARLVECLERGCGSGAFGACLP